MSRSAIATVVTTESGEVRNVLIVDESTYASFIPFDSLWTSDKPYLGQFETGEEWRAALGSWAGRLVKEECSVDAIHGEKLVYVSPQCSTYVFQIDFDS